ncbi:MAG: DNA-directed RNA polymerase subunit beta', partial [Chloroflexi bacterium]|nr:DNA-directed RNA polymerase subunit beta' [Chloroflexota bacterium]
MLEVNAFTGIRISLASPEQIRSWSYGEVIKPETINYRTLRPEKDGLFCDGQIDTTRDWECYCGKYKRIRYKGIVCDKCGVEVARAKVRRERMGHIELASPVSHIWYLAGTPSYLSILLDIQYKKLEKVVYFANYIVTKVDEEERQKALADADEALRYRIEEIHNSRAERLVEIESLREQRLQDLEENHQRDIQKHQGAVEEAMLSARSAHEEFLNQIRGLLGEGAPQPLVFEPAGEIAVEQGVTVTEDLLTAIKEQLDRWLDGEQARLDAEATKLEQDYRNKQTRFNIEAQGEADDIDQTIAQEEEAERSRFERAKQDLEQLEYKTLLSDEQFRRLRSLFPKTFEAGIGAEAVRDLILGLDLQQEAERLREIVRGDGHREKLSTKAASATKRLRVVENFRKSGARPEWMILTVLPVIPPDLRPMVQLDGGRFATSDLNDLYRRVINRNNRLKRLLELGAPDIIDGCRR